MATIQFYAIVEAATEGGGAPPTPTAPLITSGATGSGVAGTAGSVSASATGDAPITWSATGLVAGLTINASSGSVSWTTGVAAGVYTFTRIATNPAGSDSQAFTLTISEASVSVSSLYIEPSEVTRALSGSSVQFDLAAFVNGLYVTPLAASWSVIEGAGSINSSGLLTVGATGGRVTVRATPTADTSQSITATVQEVTKDMDDVSLQSLSYSGGVYSGEVLFTSGTGRVKVTASYGGVTQERIFGPGTTVPISWNLGIQSQSVKFLVVGLPAS